MQTSTSTTAGIFVATSTTATSTFAGNVTVSGTAQIGMLSGILRAINGIITTTLVNLSSDVSGILGITNGGTGITTTPAPGQILVGNSSGGYTLTSTSSLGFSSTAASSTLLSDSNTFSGVQSFTSAVISTLNTSLANIVGFIATNSTTTNATTTNLYAQSASVGSLNLGAALGIGSGGTGTTSVTGAISDFQYLSSAANTSVARSVQSKLDDEVSVKDFGAVGNGTNNDYNAINAALATGKPIHFPAGTYLYSGSYKAITNTLVFDPGAILECSSGNVHMYGNVVAGRYQIFSSGCTPSFSNGGSTTAGQNAMVYPEWWGAVADYQGGGSGTGTDNSTALQNMFSSGAHGVSFSAGTYRITTTISIAGGQTIQGVSRDTTTILMDDPTGAHDTFFLNGNGSSGGTTIQNINFQNLQQMSAGACIHVQDTYYITIENNSFGSSGASCYNQIDVEGVSADINKVYIQQNHLFYAVNDAVHVNAATSTGGEAQDVDISNSNYIQHAGHAGVGLYGNVNGLYVDTNIIFANTYGIYGDSLGLQNGFGSDKFRSNDLDSNTNAAYFAGLGASLMNDNWVTSNITFAGGGGITLTGNNFTGASSTLTLEGVQGFSVTGSKFSNESPAAVQIMPLNGAASMYVSLTGNVYEYGGGSFVAFSGSPQASNITIDAQLDNSETLYSGTATNLRAAGGNYFWTTAGNILYAPSGTYVGIGTSTPANPLDVNGNASFGSSGRDAGVTAGSTGGASALGYGTGYFAYNASRSSGNWTLLSDGAHNGGAVSWSDINGNFYLATIPNNATSSAAQTIADSQVMSDTRFFIASGGNIGIGTTTPGSIFSVAGVGNWTTGTSTMYGTGGINLTGGCFAVNGSCLNTSGASSTLLANNNTFSGSNIFSQPLSLTSTIGTTTLAAGQGFTIGGSQFVVQSGSGNVGIGTLSPTSSLEIRKDAVSTINSSLSLTNGSNSGSNGSSIFFNVGNNASAVVNGVQISDNLYSGGTGSETDRLNIAVRNNGSLVNRFNVDGNGNVLLQSSGGNVGIGSSTPFARLAVKGSGTGTSVNFETTNINNTPLLVGLDNGNVGIGTSTPGNLLDVNGNASFGTSGDRRSVMLGTTGGASALAYGTGYIGFNASRSSGNWTLLSDGSHNGGAVSWSGINGDFYIATIPNSATSTTSQTITDSQVMSDVKLYVSPGGNVGIGTTTPGSLLSLNNIANFSIGTSTLYTGLNITSGCFSVNGICVGANSASTTLFLDNNTFSGNNAFLQPLSLNATTGTTTIASGQGFIIGVNKFVVQQGSGSVGIGTSNPGIGYSLDVPGNARILGINVRTNDGSADTTNGAPWYGLGSSNITALSNNGTQGAVQLAGFYGLNLQTNGGQFVINQTGNVGIGTTSPPALFSVAGSTYHAGNVGIFTASPSYALDVAGLGHFTGLVDAANFVATSSVATSLFNGNLIVNGNTTLGNATSTSFFATTTSSTNLFAQTASLGSLSGSAFSSLGSNYLAKWNNGTWSNSLIFDNGTAIGIGTTTPGSILSIGSTNGINFSTATSTFSSTGGINLANGCFAVNGICIGATNYFTNSSASTWLSTGTKLGINNISPGYALDVTGFINTDQNFGYKQAGSTVLYASTTNNTVTLGASQAAAWMAASSTPWYDIAVGQGALATTPTNGAAQYNAAIGSGALYSNTTGKINTAVGYGALYNNTTGSYNTANGVYALYSNTTGSLNTANGQGALQNNISGSYNTASGQSALFYNQSATNTVAVGFYAARGAGSYSNQGGTAIGYNAGYNFQTGSNYNTLLGYQTGYDITTGANNIVIGQEQTTGKGISTTSGNIFLGNDLQLATSTGNTLNIGNLIFATGLGSGSTLSTGFVGIGTTSPYSKLEIWGPDTASTTAFAVVNNASTTVFASYDNGNATYSGSLFQSSDQRLKTNISSLDASSSLALVDQLSPVSYMRIDQPDQGSTLGFIAQEVQKLFPNLVTTTAATALTPGGTLTLNYTGLIAPLVAAVQALQNEIAAIQNTVAGLAQSITTGTLNSQRDNTQTLCVGSTCVTEAQLKALLAAANAASAGGSASPAGGGAGSGASSTPPVIQVNGDNPAIIQIGSAYSDLGATITGPAGDINLGIHTFVNGIAMSPVQIDTSAAATDTIDYVATDQDGLTSTSTRTVIIQTPSTAATSTNG